MFTFHVAKKSIVLEEMFDGDTIKLSNHRADALATKSLTEVS